MTPKLNCVDMSMWGGELTAKEAGDLWDAGVRNIKVGVGWSGPGGAGLWSRQQAEMWLEVNGARGGTVDAYKFYYFDQSMEGQLGQALETLKNIKIRKWWLDAEDTDTKKSADTLISIFQSALNYMDAATNKVTGVYTGGWWWRDRMANTTIFALRPLWNSYYDDNPDPSGLPYGGWNTSEVEQYGNTQDVGGQSVDIDYDSTVEDDMGVSQEEFDALKAEHQMLMLRVLAGDERPAGEDRMAYAEYQLKLGGQSVLDVAASAMYYALKADGKILPEHTVEEIRAIIQTELANAHIVLAG